MSEKLPVDMRHLSPQLLADAGELIGMSIMTAMDGPKQPLAIAAIAAVQNPERTWDEIRHMDFTDFEVTQDADPKALGASNGDAPLASVAPGS